MFQTLESLEVHNRNLLDRVRQLEAEKHIVEEYLKSCVRVPWCPFHQADGPNPPAAPHHCTPPIPEHEPIQTNGQTTELDTACGAVGGACGGGTAQCGATGYALDNCRPLDMTLDNGNRAMVMTADTVDNNGNTNTMMFAVGAPAQLAGSSAP